MLYNRSNIYIKLKKLSGNQKGNLITTYFSFISVRKERTKLHSVLAYRQYNFKFLNFLTFRYSDFSKQLEIYLSPFQKGDQTSITTSVFQTFVLQLEMLVPTSKPCQFYQNNALPNAPYTKKHAPNLMCHVRTKEKMR